jgi:DNA/RNA endonuclease YhcR with UshA esterase domain
MANPVGGPSVILPYKSRNLASGTADSLTKIAKVRGVVYGVNTYTLNQTGAQFTLIDPTAGINVRMPNSTYTVAEGDSVEVEGPVAQFNGLIQINATAITFISAGSKLKSPIVSTAMDYPLVSDLVRFNNYKLVASTWPAAPTGSGFNAKAFSVNNPSDTIYLRIIPQTADVWASVAPTTAFDLIGLGGQFSVSRLGGFQITPRRLSDIIPVVIQQRILPFKSRNLTTGIADSLTKIAKVRGVVYGVNTFSVGQIGAQFTLIDPTAGINVRMPNSTYTVAEGDSVEVEGPVGQFNGLIQINATAITFISAGSRLKSPIVSTAMDYPLVSDLVRFNNYQLVASTWPATPSGSGFTAKAFSLNNPTDTIYLRIIPQTADVWASVAPTSQFDVIGLGGQFSPSNLGGFQITPRRLSDILILTGLNTTLATEKLNVYPNPTQNVLRVLLSTGTATYTIQNAIGQVVESGTTELVDGIATTNLSKGLYTLKVSQAGKVYVANFVKE